MIGNLLKFAKCGYCRIERSNWRSVFNRNVQKVDTAILDFNMVILLIRHLVELNFGTKSVLLVV